MSDENCPKCGSNRIEMFGWSCGSSHYSANFFQSDHCNLIVRHRDLAYKASLVCSDYFTTHQDHHEKCICNLCALRRAASLHIGKDG